MCWPYALLQHLLLSVYADSTVMTDDSSRLSQFLVWVLWVSPSVYTA